jgi:hypothetical protein
MKSITQVFKKHPLALIFYIMYTSLCIRIVFLNADKNSAIHGHDGGLVGLFVSFIAVIFVLFNTIAMVFNKSEEGFYLILSLIIIFQALWFGVG